MAKRDVLVKAYIEALDFKVLTIHAGPNGRPSQIGPSRSAELEPFDALWFSKPQHAELVLVHCRDEFFEIGALRSGGWIDLPAREVRDRVVIACALLGARFWSVAEIERDACAAVDEINGKVEAMRQSGGLATVNASYKRYRQRQIEKGETAIPYSAHLAAFTHSLVVLAAQSARTI